MCLKPFDSLKIFQLQEFSWVRHDCLLHPPFTKGVFCFWKAIRLAKRLALPEMLLGGTTKKHLLETPPNIIPSPRISSKTYQQKTMAHRWRSVVQGLIAHHHMQRWGDWGNRPTVVAEKGRKNKRPKQRRPFLGTNMIRSALEKLEMILYIVE